MNLFDGESVYDGITDLSAQMGSDEGWINAKIEEFYSKLREFESLFTLLSDEAPPDELKSDYETVMNRGNILKTTISAALNSIAEIKSWFSSGGIMEKENDGNLGIVPVVLGAAIIAVMGAITAITVWLGSAYELNTKIQESKRLKAAGYSAAEITSMLSAYGGGAGSIFSNVFNIVLLLGAGLLAYKFLGNKNA